MGAHPEARRWILSWPGHDVSCPYGIARSTAAGPIPNHNGNPTAACLIPNHTARSTVAGPIPNHTGNPTAVRARYIVPLRSFRLFMPFGFTTHDSP